jgi:hypothetical protein
MAAFSGDAYFKGATFSGNAYFKGATFSGDANFWGATFSGNANFWGATFSGNANFWGATFSGNADFSSATFSGRANFESSNFNKTAYFAFSEFNKDALLSDVVFKGDTSFNDSQFKEDALFENTIFEGKLSLTRTRYTKLYIRWHDIKYNLIYDDAAYMSLMKNFKDLGYFEDYDSSYFQYRREHRGRPWEIPGEPFLKTVDFISEWSYGYGVRPMNPLLSSIILIIFFGLFWRSKGIGRTVENNKEHDSADDSHHNRGNIALKWIERILYKLSPFIFSFILFISAGKFLIDPPELPEPMKKPKSWTKRMFDIERFLGGVFLALLFISLSSTMIRAL